MWKRKRYGKNAIIIIMEMLMSLKCQAQAGVKISSHLQQLSRKESENWH